jgi:hypothetical protein
MFLLDPRAADLIWVALARLTALDDQHRHQSLASQERMNPTHGNNLQYLLSEIKGLSGNRGPEIWAI